MVQDRDKLLCIFICSVGYVGASSLLSWLLASSSLPVNFFFFFDFAVILKHRHRQLLFSSS